MATLNLNTAGRTRVWRVLKAQLQADPVYDAAGVALLFYDGDGDTAQVDLDTLGQPCLRFFPAAGSMSWFDEASASGALVVFVEARLLAPDVEDVFNLQEALEDTLNTIGDLQLQADLVTAGAVTGLVLFSRPLTQAAAAAGRDNLFRLTGQFAVEVRRPLSA